VLAQKLKINGREWSLFKFVYVPKKSVGNKFIELLSSLKSAIAVSVAKTCHR